MTVPEAKRLKALEDENEKLRASGDCTTCDNRRRNRPGSGRGWMKVQWQVNQQGNVAVERKLRSFGFAYLASGDTQPAVPPGRTCSSTSSRSIIRGASSLITACYPPLISRSDSRNRRSQVSRKLGAPM